MSNGSKDISMISNLFSTEIYEDRLLKRLFFMAKLISFVTPFLGVFYVFFSAQMNGRGFYEQLALDQLSVIVFLTSMLGMFVAFKLKDIELSLRDKQFKPVCLNFVILIVAQLFLINLMYIIMFVILLARSRAVYKFKIFQELKKVRPVDFLTDTKVSIFILLMNAFCLYVAFANGVIQLT